MCYCLAHRKTPSWMNEYWSRDRFECFSCCWAPRKPWFGRENWDQLHIFIVFFEGEAFTCLTFHVKTSFRILMLNAAPIRSFSPHGKTPKKKAILNARVHWQIEFGSWQTRWLELFDRERTVKIPQTKKGNDEARKSIRTVCILIKTHVGFLRRRRRCCLLRVFLMKIEKRGRVWVSRHARVSERFLIAPEVKLKLNFLLK